MRYCLQHRDKMKSLCRKRYSDNLFLEVIQVRERSGREEWLSRWAYTLTGPNIVYYGHTIYYGYRWRKLCGKNIFIPLLGRTAKDDHNCSITIRDPFSGKMARAYVRDFEEV